MKREQPWTLTENKSGGGWESPRFHIGYDRLPDIRAKKEWSYKILSLLKQDSDLIIRIDSQLLNLPPRDRGDVVINLISEIESLGLENRYRRSQATKSSNTWYKLLGLDRNEPVESFVYVPDRAWQDGFLHSRMEYGAFYYVCRSDRKGLELLEALINGRILNFELGNFFKLLIFDAVCSGHMGIFTDTMSLNDIKSLLAV